MFFEMSLDDYLTEDTRKMETDQSSKCHENDGSDDDDNISISDINLEDTTLEDQNDDGKTSSKHSNLKDAMNAYMLRACVKGKYDIVKKLLERDLKLLNATDDDNYTPLHRSVYSGHIEIVKLLLSKNAKIDASTVDGWKPLHCACRWGQTDIAFLLLQNGADINAQTNGGLTPLHLAAAGSCKSTLQMILMNRYTNWNQKNAADETASQVSKVSSKHYYLFEMIEDRINLLK